MDTKAWKIFTVVSVIHQLRKIMEMTVTTAEDGDVNVDGDVGVNGTMEKRRNDVLKSIDAILARVKVPICEFSLIFDLNLSFNK